MLKPSDETTDESQDDDGDTEPLTFRNVACNRGRDNEIDTEGLNVHIDYKKVSAKWRQHGLMFLVQNTPAQSSREPKLVQDTVNIIQAEERNDVQEEEIVQRPDIEAEILRNIDEEDLRLLDAQPSILKPTVHLAGDSNQVIQRGEIN